MLAYHRDVRWVLFCSLFIPQTFELVVKRLHAYADDSILLAIVLMTADRPDVAAFFNRDLARIQEWWDHWCVVL